MIAAEQYESHFAITMDDGKVNAMSAQMLGGLLAELEKTVQAPKPVLIAGREGIFSAGFDLETFTRGIAPARQMVGAGLELILRILSHPAPVVTLCTGHAYPMGAFILMSSDHAIGIDGDFRIGMNETAISIDVPDFALELARGRLSPAAFKGVPTARMHSPSQALAHGYLDAIAQPDEAEELMLATLKAYSRLDMACFASTKARANAPLIAAIRAAGLPARLAA